MVMAIITMIWRKPQLHDWSVVGFINPDGVLFGYPYVDELYLQQACECGLKTIVLSKSNGKTALADASAKGFDLEAMQLRVIPCGTMMDVVRAAVEHWNG